MALFVSWILSRLRLYLCNFDNHFVTSVKAAYITEDTEQLAITEISIHSPEQKMQGMKTLSTIF